MTNKTAKELLKILKLLLSPDKELVNLGIGLFKDTFIVQNLPKHKTFIINYKWRGDKEYVHFYNFPKMLWDKKEQFTKSQFIKMLSSTNVPFQKKACLILNLVYDLTGNRNNKKYFNARLNELLHGENLNNLLSKSIEQSEPNEFISYMSMQECFQERRKSKNYLSIANGNFADELCNLDISHIDGYTSFPNDAIRNYKFYLSARYNKKKYIFRNRKFIESYISTSTLLF